MRGQKVFDDIIKDGGMTGTQKKGRSTSLVMKRNECLIARYYYYGHLKNKTFQETIQLLTHEFYLSPNTTSRVIQTNLEMLRSLRKKGPTLYYFQNRWPHLKWIL